MKARTGSVLTGVAALLASTAAARAVPDPAPRYSLTIIVEGVADSRGVVGVLVFDSPRGWPQDFSAAFRAQAAPARNPVTELTVSDLPAAEYAVVVLHDVNSNKKLDRNWFGMPKEQWGMSNNPRRVLSAPSFDQARFRLARDQRITVRLK